MISLNARDKHQQRILVLVKILAGVVLLSASAQIVIPLPLVPVTLQTLAIALIGLYYTPKEAVLTTVSYIALGAAGLPIFKGMAGGIAYLSGITSGYLIGFIAATWIISHTKQYFQTNLIGIITRVTLGMIALYSCGVAWLSYFVGIKLALYNGFLIFLPSMICKILLLSYIIGFLSKTESTNKSS